MAYKIQLRRDLASNWTANNPLLKDGEIGIETDTLKFKIGNGSSRWNNLTFYAFKVGSADGVATLDASGKVPLSQLPDQVSLDAEALTAVTNALAGITTTNVAEGLNKYFTNARAIAGVVGSYDTIGSASNAQAAAIASASLDATNKLNTAVASSSTFTTNSIAALTTSNITEGTKLFFTDARAKSAVAADIQSAVANATISNLNQFTTSSLSEGTNLYFTNARAISATNSARTALLISVNQSIDDLRSEISSAYIPQSDRNMQGGVAGLDASSLIPLSLIPSSIARTSDISAAIASLVNAAPTSFDTLKEISDYIATDQSAGTALTTLVGNKLDSSTASSTYAPISSPTFIGTVTIPAGAVISGYSTAADLLSNLNSAKSYTDSAITGISNSLGSYVEEGDRNLSNGFAGLDSGGKILESVLPSTISAAITAATSAAATNINGTYTNGSSSSSINKITYGTGATPPSSGNAAGDIYIQY
jgi:hypothetical protein